MNEPIDWCVIQAARAEVEKLSGRKANLLTMRLPAGTECLPVTHLGIDLCWRLGFAAQPKLGEAYLTHV